MGSFTSTEHSPRKFQLLDNREAFDQDENQTLTLEKTLREELAALTAPGYLHGWE